jgi:hypothetical protein
MFGALAIMILKSSFLFFIAFRPRS